MKGRGGDGWVSLVGRKGNDRNNQKKMLTHSISPIVPPRELRNHPDLVPLENLPIRPSSCWWPYLECLFATLCRAEAGVGKVRREEVGGERMGVAAKQTEGTGQSPVSNPVSPQTDEKTEPKPIIWQRQR